MSKRPDLPPAEILTAYALTGAELSAIDVGNINRTFKVTHNNQRFILQWLNPIFDANVHFDIEAVTVHLATKGLPTPRLVRNQAGALWSTTGSGEVWRLLTFIDGDILSAGANARQCQAGGELLGRFHRALGDLQHTFANVRPGVHDTARHLRHLESVLKTHTEHRAFGDVQPLAQAILASAALIPPLGDLPARVVHGDPKLNNIVFTAHGTAHCFIDLDTLSVMTLPVELGDAFRSWCNPTGEDQVAAHFELDLFAAAINGYASATRDFVTAAEIAQIPTGVETIALELAARFCADALTESYFGWNHQAFGSASAHNLHRARCQYNLSQSIRAQRAALRNCVERAFHT